MSTTTERSATIYQFPARGRFAISGQHDEPAAPSFAPLRVKTVSGSAWYHEEAVAEERDRTN